MSFSNKQIKQLNKQLAQGKLNAKVVGSEKQGNGHNVAFVEVKGHGEVKVVGCPSTPSDWSFVGNKLRQSVARAVAAGESSVAFG